VALTRSAARFRLLIAGIAAAGVAVFLIPATATAVPQDPDPTTVSSVNQRLDDLSRKSESLAEKYNAAQIDVTAKQKAADKAQLAARRALVTYRSARGELGDTVKTQYEGAQFSSTGALLSSANEANYLDKVEALSLLNVHRSAVVGQLISARTAANKAEKTAADLLAQAKSVRDALTKQRADVDAQTKKFTDLLATLTAKEQQAYRDRNAATPQQMATTQTTTAAKPAQPAAPPAVGGGSAKAQIAVAYARAQLGKPYVWGAAGPDAFDCSGLTMMAWAAAGVQLSHYAPTQMQVGAVVPIQISSMLPGDLIFLYPDVGHVEIYAGNGMAISAPQTGDVVKYVSVAYDMPDIVGVRRMG
jgi:cell wall-associated NlpC family hydrolase